MCAATNFKWRFVVSGAGGGGNDVQWCFSQVKGAIDDDVAEGEYLYK